MADNPMCLTCIIRCCFPAYTYINHTAGLHVLQGKFCLPLSRYFFYHLSIGVYPDIPTHHEHESAAHTLWTPQDRRPTLMRIYGPFLSLCVSGHLRWGSLWQKMCKMFVNSCVSKLVLSACARGQTGICEVSLSVHITLYVLWISVDTLVWQYGWNLSPYTV